MALDLPSLVALSLAPVSLLSHELHAGSIRTTDSVMIELQAEPMNGRIRNFETLNELKRALISKLRPEQRWAVSEDEITSNEHLMRLLDDYTGDACFMNREDLCRNLSARLWTYWEKHQSSIALMACIEVERETLGQCPTEHPNRAMACSSLASSLFVLFRQTGDSSLLDEATRLQREVLQHRPPGHPSRLMSCNKLASSLKSHFKQTGEGALLDEAIKLQREALDLCPTGHSYQAMLSSNLAGSLFTQFQRTGEDMLLDEATKLQREALHQHPHGHPNRSMFCNSLANSLSTRFERTGEISLLNEAIMLQREALGLCSPGHSDRAMSCNNLASLLKLRFHQNGHSVLLDETIQLQREALQICAHDHADRAMVCNNLANTLKLRFERTGESALLEEVVSLQREALSLRRPGHSDRAMSCNNLANLLKLQFQKTGQSALLDEAVKLHREALDLCPRGRPDRFISCNNLASSLKLRFDRTGENELLNEAISLQQEAIDLCLPGHPDRGTLCNNLANSLSSRCQQTRENALLDRAIKLQQEALDLRPPGHPDRAISCNNLANLLKSRFQETGEGALLSEATQLQREALHLRPPGHPSRAVSCSNLANSLKSHFEQSGEIALLDEAAKLQQEALSVSMPGDPSRWRYSWQLADISQRSSPRSELQAIIGYLHQVFNASSYDDINLVLVRAVRTLLCINASSPSPEQWQDVLTLHASAINTVALAAGLAVNTSTQLQHTLRGISLGSAAFSLAIKLNNLSTGIQLLERARGVLWSQLLHIRDPQLDCVPKELACQLRDVLNLGDASRYDSDGAELRQSPIQADRGIDYAKRSQLQDIVRQVRSLPGLTEFMRGPTAEKLISAAARSFVVVLVAGKSDSNALVIERARTTLTLVPLPGITQQLLGTMNFTGINRGKRDLETQPDSDDRFMAPVQNGMLQPYACLARAWRQIIKPVLKQLGLSRREGRVRPRVHWCPTGAFAFVPIHAAGIYQGESQECCSDYCVSSYTPTLAALLQAQKRVRTFSPQDIKLLAIAAEYAHDKSGPRLRYVPQEIESVFDAVKKAGASAHSDVHAMSTPGVVDMIKTANMVHFACHGNQHRSEPHKSHFCLTTGNLSVAELMQVDLKDSFFAFLSACETAKGDSVHTEEVVHLAATMLFAGFKSVVATMWAMRDEDGPFIAKHFYEKLFDGDTIDVDAVPYALDDAVRALRAEKVPPARWATFIHMGV